MLLVPDGLTLIYSQDNSVSEYKLQDDLSMLHSYAVLCFCMYYPEVTRECQELTALLLDSYFALCSAAERNVGMVHEAMPPFFACTGYAALAITLRYPQGNPYCS